MMDSQYDELVHLLQEGPRWTASKPRRPSPSLAMRVPSSL